MCFKLKEIGVNTYPIFEFAGGNIEFVTQCKYLGTIVEQNGSVLDIERQMRNLYAKANALGSKFKLCSKEVKRQLFQLFCANLYCCRFWYEAKKGDHEKLRSAYNNCFRRIMRLSKYCSDSEMFAVNGVLSFGEMFRKQIFTFRKHLTECTCNSLITSAVYPKIGFNSTISSWWHNILYV